MEKMVQNSIAKIIGLYINVLSYVAPSNAVQLSYKLFSEPRKGKLKLHSLPKTLQKAEHNSYQYNNDVIQTYTWRGNNEIIFLIHGWESNGSRWKKLLKQLLTTGKTIIAIDAPAHGLSSGKEFTVLKYAEFIDFIAQKFPPQIIIGHSVGGQATAFYQANYKTNLEKIVLLGAPSDLYVIFKNYVNMLSLNNKVYLQLKAYMLARFNIKVEEFSSANFLENCTIKGIIAHDVDDSVVLIDEAKKLSKAWKNAKFIETKGLGHSLHDQYLYKTIIDFIVEK